MALTTITAWTLQSPDASVWTPTISKAGTVTYTKGGSLLTVTPPVFQGAAPAIIWTPSISNGGVVTLTSGTASSQLWASLIDPSGSQWVMVADIHGVADAVLISQVHFLLARTQCIGTMEFGGGAFGGDQSRITATARLALRIGPQDATPYLKAENYQVDETLNQRNTCTVTLHLTNVSWRPIVGQEFILFEDRMRLFAGSVESIDESLLDENLTKNRVLRVQAVDYNQLADRHLVAESYQDMSAGAIVQSIMSSYLAQDGVTAGFIDTGPVALERDYAYVTVADALNDLCTLAGGWSWNIDYYKRLFFFSRSYQVSPVVITSSNAIFRQMKGTTTRDQYRNSQVIQGGTALTSPQFEKKLGDGATQSFTLGYPLNDEPFITRGTTSTFATPDTVEVRSQGVTADWYWSVGSDTITQGTTQILFPGEVLGVTYIGQFPLVSISDNPAAIADRANVEGDSGRYESMVNDQAANSESLAFAEAAGLLSQYGSIKQDITFVTTRKGITCGDLLTVSVPELGLSGQYLVTSLRFTNWRFTDREYTVTASNGGVRGNFAEFFRLLANQGPVVNLSNQVVSRPLIFAENLAWTDVLTATTSAAGSNFWGTALVGASEWSS